MALRRPWLLAFVAAIALARAASPAAQSWVVPPLDGELHGDLGPAMLDGRPPLKWSLAVRTEKPGERVVAFAVDGDGFQLHGLAKVDPLGNGTWRVTAAKIDLGKWFSWLAERWSTAFGSVSLAGALQLQAEGTLQGGTLGGRMSLSLREGRLDDPQHKLTLEGISVDVEFADIAAQRTESEQVFTWRSGQYDVVKLGVGRIEFSRAGDELRVNNAAIDVFGGELRVGSLVMSVSKPEFSVTAQMNGVAVEQILFLLPPMLAEARGRVDGNMALKRDASGIQIGNGRLSLREGETAELRLAMRQGWLTTSLPPEVLKHFPAFQKLENGEIPMRARVLEITFTPLGDAQGRTAWIHVAGGPSDPELTAPIDANINVRGPLNELVKIGADLGTDSRLRFSGQK